MADGREQVLPAKRAEHIGQGSDHQGRHDQIQPRAGHLGADVPQVRVSQEKREQSGSHEQHDDRPQVLAHAAWANYTPPTRGIC